MALLENFLKVKQLCQVVLLSPPVLLEQGLPCPQGAPYRGLYFGNTTPALQLVPSGFRPRIFQEMQGH